MDVAAMHALVRFGFGGTAGTPAPSDPKAGLLAQLQDPDPAGIGPRLSVSEAFAALRADREAKSPPRQYQTALLYRRDALSALGQAVTSTTPFRERLAWFWANHFTVSRRRGQCAGLIGPFIQDAIRPNVTGRFSDMLLAVVRHPAMLVYLDNVGSVGPGSRAGQRSGRGLNENLARECLELHTVGPEAGYSQADVTNFAKILTGWSVQLNEDPPGFKFRPSAHEPGEHILMGRRFPEGEQGGIEALEFLATHKATYRHIARKLVCHFASDDPAPESVRRLEAVLHDTGGNLGAASKALINLPAAWKPHTKLRTPTDLIIACSRMLGLHEALPASLGSLRLLGQPMWSAPQPDGWPDRAVDWVTPEAVMRRVDFAYAIAGWAADRDPQDLAETGLGPLLRPATRNAIERAGSRREALGLLLACPEFQRR